MVVIVDDTIVGAGNVKDAIVGNAADLKPVGQRPLLTKPIHRRIGVVPATSMNCRNLSNPSTIASAAAELTLELSAHSVV